jgi:hypothetical protein
MMMRNSSKNDFSTVWQYYFIRDPEKAKKVLEVRKPCIMRENEEFSSPASIIVFCIY